MQRFFILMVSLSLMGFSFSQEDLAILKEQDIQEMRVDRHFNFKYKRQLSLLLRTYPMALEAKALIDQYEADLAEIEKSRKQKKYSKEAHKNLKEEFSFNIRDLYKSEGEMLMKLVHRETGMTVSEIIKSYRGGFQNSVYSNMAKLWGHDLDAKYDPLGEDWITEIVLQDIESGRIQFDTTMRKMDKASYKESMRAYRSDRKEYRQEKRKKKGDKTKKSRP